MKKVLFLFVALMALSFTSQAQLLATFGNTGKHAWLKADYSDPVTKQLPDYQGYAKAVVVVKTHKIRFEFDAALLSAKTMADVFSGGKLFVTTDLTIPDKLYMDLTKSSGINDLPKTIAAGGYNITKAEKNGKVTLSIVTK